MKLFKSYFFYLFFVFLLYISNIRISFSDESNINVNELNKIVNEIKGNNDLVVNNLASNEEVININNEKKSNDPDQDLINSLKLLNDAVQNDSNADDNKLSETDINDVKNSISNNYQEIYSKKINLGNKRNKKTNLDIKVVNSSETKEGSSLLNMKEAYNCFTNKQYELALYYYKKSLKKNKNNNEAKFGLATSYHMLRQYNQAIDLYIELISNNYSRKKVVNNLFIALQNKTYYEALEKLTSINTKSPGYADILAQIGVIYIHLGDNVKAISALSRANELSPYNALISYNLGTCYDNDKNYDYAKHFYEQAIRNDISDIISSNDYSKLTERIEQLDKLIKDEIEKTINNNRGKRNNKK